MSCVPPSGAGPGRSAPEGWFSSHVRVLGTVCVGFRIQGAGSSLAHGTLRAQPLLPVGTCPLPSHTWQAHVPFLLTAGGRMPLPFTAAGHMPPGRDSGASSDSALMGAALRWAISSDSGGPEPLCASCQETTPALSEALACSLLGTQVPSSGWWVSVTHSQTWTEASPRAPLPAARLWGSGSLAAEE